jgi:uncharacterized protein YbjT (DUF2867 family)
MEASSGLRRARFNLSRLMTLPPSSPKLPSLIRENRIVEIAGPERAPFNEIVARYLKAVGDPRKVVKDPEAQYFGGQLEETSLLPLGEARLGRYNLEEWLRRSQKRA